MKRRRAGGKPPAHKARCNVASGAPRSPRPTFFGGSKPPQQRRNEEVGIMNYEKCIDNFCLLSNENPLTNKEDFDKYYHEDCLIFINKEKSMYLRMTHYPGDSKYNMSLFEVGYISTIDTSVSCEYDGSFITNNNTELGEAEENIIELQGNPLRILFIGNCKVYYYKVEESSSKFVEENGECAYIIEYWFADGKLVKLIFGFEYP